MPAIEGYVEKIVYRNEDNGYTVLTVSEKGDEVTLVGTFNYIGEGELLYASGEYTEHPMYGEQLVVSEYEIKAPKDTIAIERYLGSGAIKGVGASLAARIVRKFGIDTFKVIDEEPERLASVKGISERKAMEIASQVEEKRDMRKAMIFLQEYGISMNLSAKIYNAYGQDIYTIIKQNPYKMADDIAGVGFKIADDIAVKAGIRSDSDFRIKSGILYTLNKGSQNGHTYLPIESLINHTRELLCLDLNDIDKYLMDLQIDKRIIVKELDGNKIVYTSQLYNLELSVAGRLRELNTIYSIDEKEFDKNMNMIEKKENISLDAMQRKSVKEAIMNGVLVITGGPGTGKTTTINTIIKYFELEGLEIMLAAPTGRAAKRMKEATGYEAQTIHRMLEINGGNVDDSISNATARFERNEDNPLETDVVIIDEMSMVDVGLMNSLLRAIAVGTRLILVGDVNQLPSVGPGNVLNDIIQSQKYSTVMLTKIFRQATTSDIIVNAHKINKGEKVDLTKKSLDFLFLKRNDANAIINAMITLIREKLPNYVHAKPLDIQVLTPMRKGPLGVERLNTILQEYLNPKEDGKIEKETTNGLFRVGDKVMQTKNNYQLEWKVGNSTFSNVKGVGVFNGDCGIIRSINTFSEEVEIEFDENRFATYTFKQLDEIELAYAVTIHKSQGSEYPAVIIPLLTGPKMLMNKNLLYTAVTRARNCVTIVGLENTFYDMANNESEQKRYSSLWARIEELS